MADWVTAKSADGPKVAAWIAKHIPELDYQDNPNAMRQVCRWQAGGRIGIDVLDKLLLRYHHQLWELPDDVWYAQEARAARKPIAPRKDWKEMETRHCCLCGGELKKRYSSGRRVSPSRYNRLQYCSNACKFEGQVAA